MSITSETVEQHPPPGRRIPEEVFDLKGGKTVKTGGPWRDRHPPHPSSFEGHLRNERNFEVLTVRWNHINRRTKSEVRSLRDRGCSQRAGRGPASGGENHGWRGKPVKPGLQGLDCGASAAASRTSGTVEQHPASARKIAQDSSALNGAGGGGAGSAGASICCESTEKLHVRKAPEQLGPGAGYSLSRQKDIQKRRRSIYNRDGAEARKTSSGFLSRRDSRVRGIITWVIWLSLPRRHFSRTSPRRNRPGPPSMTAAVPRRRRGRSRGSGGGRRRCRG